MSSQWFLLVRGSFCASLACCGLLVSQEQHTEDGDIHSRTFQKAGVEKMVTLFWLSAGICVLRGPSPKMPLST
eukprot:1300405-Amphidinium_carterae.1